MNVREPGSGKNTHKSTGYNITRIMNPQVNTAVGCK